MEATQIRWSKILNRDPTPPSDFWPPLQTDYLIPPPRSGPVAGEVVTAGLSRREAYVISMQSTALSSQIDYEGSSLHSLKTFLEKGIGVDAIRNSVQTSRITSMDSSHRSLVMPPERLEDLGDEKVGYDRNSMSSDEVSLLEMLRASPVPDRSQVARKTSGETGIVPANWLGQLFKEKRSEVAGSNNWFVIAGYVKTYPQLVKTTCARGMSAIKKRSEKLYRVTKWRQPRARRFSNYKRKSGIGPYDGT